MAADSPPPRTRSARLTLVSLLLIPLLSLAALWGLSASITLGNVIRYQHYNTVISTISPSVTALEQSLPVEGAITLVWMGSERRSAVFQVELENARHTTDAYTPAVRSALMSVRGLLSAKTIDLMNTFLADLAQLHQLRAAVDAGAVKTVTAFNAYSAISTAEIEFFQNASPPADPQLGLMTQAAIAEARAQGATGGAVSLIEGAIAAGGLMPQPERVLFAQVVGQQNLEIGDTFSLAPPVMTALFQRVYSSPAYRKLQAIENQIEASPVNRPIPVDTAAFQLTAQAIQAAVQANGAQVGVMLAAQSAKLRNGTVTELAVAAGVGLLAVAASVFVMARFGRRLRVELSDLFDSARQMADERLPRIVDRLRRGGDVDVEEESPPVKAGRITEIADVAQAFSTVQRTAVEAAVGQANLRKSVNQVFVNLSLRNQSLLHRQLGMLDSMERATSDSALLADLFRLDHLTTRMRRHAEGLLILAGATPGRGWRDPVPLVDVLHAAIAEVEDYVRVDVLTDSTDAVTGTAVNDVIHMIAELIENATVFSPPNTRVTITGGVVGQGFAVEVEDRGLGMAPEVMAAINERLASPPEFDLANSDQLGLFVAGQLAARHGIRVALRPSYYGGTTAIVVLPRKIIVPEREASTWSGPGSVGELPTANGWAHEAEPAGNLEQGPAFGVTGRHHRLVLSALPEDGGADARAELAGGGETPLAGIAPLPSAAPDQPGWPAPRSAQAQPESPVAATQGKDSGETADFAGPIRFSEPHVSNGSIGSIAATEVAGSGPPSSANDAAADETYLGLPRRVRQANLASQLRGRLGAEPVTSYPASYPLYSHEAAMSSARSPEQTGSRLAALQDGWLRGRLDDMDSSDADPAKLDPGGQPGSASGEETESDDREAE